MRTVELSDQSVKLIDTICRYTDNTEILDAVAAVLYYDAPELKRRLNDLKNEVGEY